MPKPAADLLQGRAAPKQGHRGEAKRRSGNERLSDFDLIPISVRVHEITFNLMEILLEHAASPVDAITRDDLIELGVFCLPRDAIALRAAVREMKLAKASQFAWGRVGHPMPYDEVARVMAPRPRRPGRPKREYADPRPLEIPDRLTAIIAAQDGALGRISRDP